MTRRRTILVAALLALILLVATMPLAVVLPGRETGLTSRRAEGTIWDGLLREAHFGGLTLGDTAIALEVMPLILGEARFDVTAPLLKGAVTTSSGTLGLRNATGTIDASGRFMPLPLASIGLDGVDAVFAGKRCLHAAGRVRATLSGEIAGLALPGGLSGIARCDGDALLLPLAGQSGLERIDLRLSANGRWRAVASIKPGDPALAAKLMSAGFTQGEAGLSMRLSGVF